MYYTNHSGTSCHRSQCQHTGTRKIETHHSLFGHTLHGRTALWHTCHSSLDNQLFLQCINPILRLFSRGLLHGSTYLLGLSYTLCGSCMGMGFHRPWFSCTHSHHRRHCSHCTYSLSHTPCSVPQLQLSTLIILHCNSTMHSSSAVIIPTKYCCQKNQTNTRLHFLIRGTRGSKYGVYQLDRIGSNNFANLSSWFMMGWRPGA